MSERDMSDHAVLERYRRANEMAIATFNSLTFDSLRDVFTLVNERKQLNIQIQELKAEIQTLKCQD